MSALAILAFALIFWWARVQHTDAEERILTGSNADMYVYHLPVREYGFGHLRMGELPLWNPYTNCGMPFFATYQAAVFYPLNLPHWLLDGAVAISLIYLVHIFLAGLFMYLWVRELGCTSLAGAFAGIAYMLCPFVNHPLVWPHIILCHTWIPVIFVLIHRTFAGKRWTGAALLGGALGCQFLAGYMQGFVYTLYGAFAYLVFLAAMELRKPGRESRELLKSVGFTLLGLTVIPALFTAFQWIPTFQLSTLSARPPGGLARDAILTGGSLHPSAFLSVLVHPDSFKWHSYALYPGVLTLLMAAFAFVQGERWRTLAFFSALAVVSALVALGSNTPAFSLYMLLPTSDWFRLPNRLLILTAFSIATCAGMGFNHLIESVLVKSKPLSEAPGRHAIFIAICGTFMLLVPKGAAIYVFVLLIGYLLGTHGRSAMTVGILAILLVGLDLTLYVSDRATYPWITRDVFPELKEEKEFLRNNVGLDRVHIFRRKRDWKNFLLNANFGMIEGIRETSGYESLSLQRYAEFCAFLETGGQPSYEKPFVGWRRWASDSLHPRMLNLLGARLIVEDVGRDLHPENAPPNTMPKNFKLKKVFSGELNIYENPDALPRAFFATNVEVIPEKRMVLERLASPSFDYKKSIILEEPPEPPHARADASAGQPSPQVVVKPKNEEEIDLVVDVPRSGFIFLNDMYMPGWRAYVDGMETRIYRADYLFMAIPVEVGKHTVEMQYTSPGFSAGAWISLLSVALISLSMAFDLARNRAKEMAPWEGVRRSSKPPVKRKP